MEEKLALSPSWREHLKAEFTKSYFKELQLFLKDEYAAKKVIYPPLNEIFSAFHLTPFEQVKVVILGQDPYHGEGQAHGLAFSVQKNIPLPPSLKNIFKELHSDLGISPPSHGDLTSWANEGVLLLNSVLTVEEKKAGSHHQKGWEIFTDRVIELLNDKKENLVFILWGSPAQKKCRILDEKKHLVLKAPHPSPLSSYRGFFGSKPFSQTNDHLKERAINWQLD